MRSPCHFAVSLTALLFAAAVLTPSPAVACGGTFCSGGGGIPPIPVEQNSERILFEVHPDGMISSTVEVSYTGDPLAFAWVVPIPSTPTLDVVPEQVLNLIDAATAPQMTGQRTVCRGRRASCSGEAVAWVEEPMTLARAVTPVKVAAGIPMAVLGCAASGDDDDYLDEDYDPVQVEDIPRVGPYEPTVVSSEDPEALINWLNTEGYFISESMEPYVAAYVTSGSKFLAMKLAPGAGVSDIAPIRMTYEGTAPQIPLILTAVAAEPEMAITAFVAGDSRYQAGNYANLLMDPAWLRYDQNTLETNYYAVASWLTDGVGGAAFFTEYSGAVGWSQSTSDEADEWLVALSERHSTLSRLFTRLSAWEMTEDPFFEPSEGRPVPSQINLSGNAPIDVCGTEEALGVCGATYCGPGAMCAGTGDGAGCVCPEGWVAREIARLGADPGTGIQEITCQRLDHSLFSGEDLGVEPGDVCVPGMCGDDGECVDLNGFPTCACDEGFAAVPGFEGAPTCQPIIDTFSPEEALVNGDVGVGFASGATPGSTQAAEVVLGLLILLVPGLLASRRRER